MPVCSFSEGAAMFDVTPIENMFLLEFMPSARGDALRVYLYARMLCLHPELGGSVKDIAQALDMVEDDVLEAFSYWEQKGLVEKLSDRPPEYALRPLNSRSFSGQAMAVVDQYRELRSAVDKLFEGSDYVHGKQFSLIKDWIEDLNYTEAAVLRILEYEIRQPGGKKPPAVFKRADKRAIEWHERGIRTLEDVEDAIRYEGRIYRMASMVIGELSLNHIPTRPELECARRWIEEWKLDEQAVLAACGETLKSRAPSFAYLDSVLAKKKGGNAGDEFDQVKKLMDELGVIGAKPAPSQISSYRQWLAQGFEPDAILLAAGRCARKNWHSFEKLEEMLEQWHEAGVHTLAQAEIYLEKLRQSFAETKQLLHTAGLSRSPGADDLRRYEDWKNRFSTAMLSYAAECSRGMAKPVLYMEKLLAAWEKSGVATVDAAKAQREKIRVEKKPAAGRESPVNFQQRSYTKEESEKDYFDLEKFFAEGGDQI